MRILQCVALVVSLLVVPSLGQAAYNQAECMTKVRLSGGQTRCTFEFRGNAGEPTVTRSYTSSHGTVNLSVREWVAETYAELDALQGADGVASLQNGATPSPANKVIAAKTAKQIWREKHQNYMRFKDSDVAAIAAARAALKADLEATFLLGYLSE